MLPNKTLLFTLKNYDNIADYMMHSYLPDMLNQHLISSNINYTEEKLLTNPPVSKHKILLKLMEGDSHPFIDSLLSKKMLENFVSISGAEEYVYALYSKNILPESYKHYKFYCLHFQRAVLHGAYLFINSIVKVKHGYISETYVNLNE